MKRLNIRLRLTLWHGAVLGTILVAFSGAVYALMSHHLLALTDASLAEELQDLKDEVGRTHDVNTLAPELMIRFASHSGYEFQVTGAGGKALFRSDGIGAQGLPMPGRTPEGVSFATVELERLGRARLARRSARGPSGPVLLEAIIALASYDHALRQLLLVLLLTGPLGLAASLGAGYLLARKALSPVDQMVATAAEITATRLDRRIEVPNSDDELGRLARTLNGMMERLARSFEEVRRFTADAAHELRTPLAAMRTAAEVALRSPRAPARDGRVLEDLLEEIERLSRLVSNLLFLSREDAGLPGGERRPVRVDELLRDVAGHMQVVADEKAVSLIVDRTEPCLIDGDPDRLRQLFFNLLDNAIRYTPPGGTVRVRGEPSNGHAQFVVTDTGIGIGPEHLPQVFQRFYRVDAARTPGDGAGLGLAICRAIAEAHHGRLEIQSAPGSGTTAILSLPSVAPFAS